MVITNQLDRVPFLTVVTLRMTCYISILATRLNIRSDQFIPNGKEKEEACLLLTNCRKVMWVNLQLEFTSSLQNEVNVKAAVQANLENTKIKVVWVVDHDALTLPYMENRG